MAEKAILPTAPDLDVSTEYQSTLISFLTLQADLELPQPQASKEHAGAVLAQSNEVFKAAFNKTSNEE